MVDLGRSGLPYCDSGFKVGGFPLRFRASPVRELERVSRRAERDGDGDGGGGGDAGEGGGQEGSGAYEGDKSARGGDRRAQQPAALPGRVPEDLQHLLPEERQVGGHVRTEAT